MHLNAQRPIFVPDSCFGELDKLSKAAWMDIAWDFATRNSGGDSLNTAAIMTELRDVIDIVTRYRKQEREHERSAQTAGERRG